MEFKLSDEKGRIVFLVFFSFIHISDAVKCRICEFGVKSQDQCLKVADCINLDVCYTELYIENDGSQTFYSGCRSRQVCENNNAFVGAIVGKREVHHSPDQRQSADTDSKARVKRDQKSGQNICTACCDTDFCNEHQCNLSPANQTTSTCYKCDNVANLDDCTQLTTCSDTERCYTAQKYAGGGMTVYSMGCESIQICDRMEYYLSTDGIVGRRAIDDDRRICLSCCPYSYCNRLEDCSKNQRAPSLSILQSSSDAPTGTTASTQAQLSTTSQQLSTSMPKTTTAKTRGQWCYECSGELCGVIDSPPILCNSSAPYCLNSYVQEVGKTPSITKSCTDEVTCDLKWYTATSDRDECFNLLVHHSFNVACYYCCVEDYCNAQIVPNANTLYDRN